MAHENVTSRGHDDAGFCGFSGFTANRAVPAGVVKKDC